jgi:hypothetical protein
MSTNPHIITLQEAQEMTYAYQDAIQFQGQTISSAIDLDAITQLINQSGCTGIRIYFGLTSSNKLAPVIVGYDENDLDMANGIILNRGKYCPINCHPSPLIQV